MSYPTPERRPIERREARHLEERFLAAVGANADRLTALPPRPAARPLPAGALRRTTAPFDRLDHVKALMAERGLFDRAILDEMPADRACVITFARRGLFRRGPVARLVALTVNPLEGLAVDGRADQPATLAQLSPRLEGLMRRDGRFHYVAAFSPTGWEPSAVQEIPAGDDYEVYLVERGDGTQWLVHGRGAMGQVFDPETEAERLARCRAFIRSRRGDTMLAGLAADSVAAHLRVDRRVAEQALRDAARHDEHLLIRTVDGEMRLVHTEQATGKSEDRLPGWSSRDGARRAMPSPHSPGESPGRRESMGLWQRLLQWLGLRQATPSRQTMIRELEERRARLQVQRDQLDSRIEDLERTQRELGEQLKAEESPTRRVGLAQKIANVRRRVKQMHRRISLFDKAIAVHNTHIDNLTIAAEAKAFALPSEEEMKDIAVEVDEAVEAVNEVADLALGMDTAAATDTADPEVEAILSEFGVAEPTVKAPAQPAARPEARRQRPAAPPEQAERAAEPPPREPAPPEAD